LPGFITGLRATLKLDDRVSARRYRGNAGWQREQQMLFPPQSGILRAAQPNGSYLGWYFVKI
jgi:hypothetical protein